MRVWVIGACIGWLLLGMHGVSESRAQEPNELRQPPICSAATASTFQPPGVCVVSRRSDAPDGNVVKVNLRAGRAGGNDPSLGLQVAGYRVKTEAYNDRYLTPVIQAMPGDAVAAHLENALEARQHDAVHAHGPSNLTNLHYFHGGIVTPRNWGPPPTNDQPEGKDGPNLGNGDNIYVHLREAGPDGRSNTFDFYVPIPGRRRPLDGRVLEKQGPIEHPSGLNWYHSHLHGYSSDQVMGGMSGLLSIGADLANVRAACLKDSSGQCTNDVDADTDALRKATDVSYVLLRDIRLTGLQKRPDEVNGGAVDGVGPGEPADWNPKPVDFPENASCGAWDPARSALDMSNIALRTGFCQSDLTSAWLFTLNGQRFPTITVEGDRNLLLRIGNISANLGYWLELQKEEDVGKPKVTGAQMTILSIDGVVPVSPVAPDALEKPVLASRPTDVLVMPASRFELYIRNDQEHPEEQVYVLKTRRMVVSLDTGNGAPDSWPEVLLAKIKLKPTQRTSPVEVGLNALQPGARAAAAASKAVGVRPPGCIRDLEDPREYRRVSFNPDPDHPDRPFRVKTEIIRPDPGMQPEGQNKPPPNEPVAKTTVDASFETYAKDDGGVFWDEEHPHVCIKLDHKFSHAQLWVLHNNTDLLHNFHIHQIKFRLATRKEIEAHGISLNGVPAHACDPDCANGPDYQLYSDRQDLPVDEPLEWHDVIPVPMSGNRVFLVMSFDAPEQIGRFVYHCHILKHEDVGLMAPIEVWSDIEAPPDQ
jgi:FtsP/CotA-like multicopper oxidase with cupredoxin domain